MATARSRPAPPLEADVSAASITLDGEVVIESLPTSSPPSLPAQPGEDRAELEMRKLAAETARAELDLEVARRREIEAEADADRARTYTFYSDVDAEAVRRCLADLGQWSRRDPGAPITVIFNSPGGSVLDGLALFDYLRRLRAQGHEVTTVAIGRAASMGAVLLQAGDRRLIGENTFLLVHEVSHTSIGKVSEMEDSVEFSRRLQKRLLSILASRAALTEAQIQRRWARKDWWLDAAEAVELGLADGTF